MSCMASRLPNANASPQEEPMSLEPTDILRPVVSMNSVEQSHCRLLHRHHDHDPEIVAWSWMRTQE